jgi:integrase
MSRQGSVTRRVHPVTGDVTFRARAPRSLGRKGLGDYPTEAEAWKALADVLEELGPNRGGMTLREWGVIWKKRRKASGLVKSWKNHESKWRSLIDSMPIADKEVGRLTRMHVVRWVRALLRRKPQRQRGEHLDRDTVKGALTLLRCALQDAADDGKCARNVARDVRVPKVHNESEPARHFLALDELSRLLTCKPPRRASTQAIPIYTVMAYTALRPSELWRLRWCDVTLAGDRPELAVTKSKSGEARRVPLLGPALAALRALPRGIGQALVFPGKGGKPHVEGYDAGWWAWKRDAGINPAARLYDLRHTCASHLLMGSGQGYPTEAWSIERVSAFLGHSDIKVTQKHYASFAPGWLDGPAREARQAWEVGPNRDHDASSKPRQSGRKATE